MSTPSLSVKSSKLLGSLSKSKKQTRKSTITIIIWDIHIKVVNYWKETIVWKRQDYHENPKASANVKQIIMSSLNWLKQILPCIANNQVFSIMLKEEWIPIILTKNKNKQFPRFLLETIFHPTPLSSSYLCAPRLHCAITILHFFIICLKRYYLFLFLDWKLFEKLLIFLHTQHLI